LLLEFAAAASSMTAVTSTVAMIEFPATPTPLATLEILTLLWQWSAALSRGAFPLSRRTFASSAVAANRFITASLFWSRRLSRAFTGLCVVRRWGGRHPFVTRRVVGPVGERTRRAAAIIAVVSG
jgi:hypothetical protein